MSVHAGEHVRPHDGTSRRMFLAGAAGVAGALAAAAPLTSSPAQAQEARGTTAVRTYARGSQTLELDGVGVGVLPSATGGDPVGEVVHEPALTYYAKKHLAAVRYEDIVLQADLSMGQAVYDWVGATWSGQFPRKNGAIVVYDYDGTPRSRRTFTGTLLAETTIPALDASSKDAAFLSLRLVPESTATTNGSVAGSRSQPATGKKWISSNFRMEIDGLNCSRVSKIDALTIKQAVAQDDVGQPRDGDTAVGTIAFPDLVVTLSASTAKSWEQWFDDFVVGGQNGDQFERSGTLQLLAPDLKEVLATIGFFGLGIHRLVAEPADDDKTGRVRAHMYCERMSFVLGPTGA